MMADLSDAQRQALVNDSVITPMRERTPLQHAVAAVRTWTVAPAAAMIWTLERARAERIPPLSSFSGLEDIVLLGFDENTGLEHEVGVVEFARNPFYFRNFSLLLLGASGLGKTWFARHLAMMWAVYFGQEAGVESRQVAFVETNDLDSLRKVSDQLRAHVPVLFDEVTLDDPAQFQHMSVNLAKLLVNTQANVTLHARNNNVCLYSGQARIFTSNAGSFADFLGSVVPPGSVHFTAVRRRMYVGRVDRRLVPPASRTQAASSTAGDTDAASAVLEAALAGQ
eukprot:1320352-Alexandrium_andersonii.AAC.1